LSVWLSDFADDRYGPDLLGIREEHLLVGHNTWAPEPDRPAAFQSNRSGHGCKLSFEFGSLCQSDDLVGRRLFICIRLDPNASKIEAAVPISVDPRATFAWCEDMFPKMDSAIDQFCFSLLFHF
jgi:hypothetical protein